MNLRSPTRRETIVGAGTALAVAGGGGVLGTLSDAAPFGFGRSDEMGTLTACSFNILHDTSKSDHPWKSRRPRVIEAIDGIGPDLLGIQEALPGQFEDLREAFPDYGWFGLGREGDEKSEAVPVAWSSDRFEMRDTGNFWLSPTPEKPSIGWEAQNPRVSTWASLTDEATGTDVWFCNAHVSPASWRTRRNSAEVIRRRATERAENGEAVVVSIDLNNEPSTPSYKTITGRTDAGSSPVVDGRRTAEETAEASVHGPKNTYHAFTNEAKERLDYVFTPDTADVREYRTLEIDDGAYRSDHLPVAAEFEL